VPQVLLGAALGLALLTHLSAFWHPFVDADIVQVVSNPYVQAWRYLPRYFTSATWTLRCTGGNYYRPVFLLWLRLNHVLFGLTPAGWHAAALLLHLLATTLVYLLVATEFKDRLPPGEAKTGPAGDPRIAAGLAAMIFAVHPVAVEGVVWISGASEPLMASLFLTSMLCYFRSRKTDGTLWKGISVLLFLAAAGANETALVLPLLVLLYEWQRPAAASLGGRWRAAWTGGMPYLIATLVYLVARLAALHGLAPVRAAVTLGTALASWPEMLQFYVLKLLLPMPLGFFYDLEFVVRLHWWNFLMHLIVLLAVGTGLVIWARRVRGVAMACAWMFLPLLPAMAGAVRFGNGDLVHDRYLYLPLAGFAALGAIALQSAPAPRLTWLRLPLGQAVILALLVAVYGVLSLFQTETWSSNRRLYGHAFRIAQNNPALNVAVGQELAETHHVQAAQEFYQRALAADANFPPAYFWMGFSSLELGKPEEAEKWLSRETSLVPDACGCFFLGVVQEIHGKSSRAETSFRRALALPGAPNSAHFQLGAILEHEGRLAEARDQYQAGLAVDFDAGAKNELEKLNGQLGAPVK
jgi:tetratricopeptide (TPR) repeat protein